MSLKHGPILTSPQNHNAKTKCIESLLNKKCKHKTKCDLVNISTIYIVKRTNGKYIMST